MLVPLCAWSTADRMCMCYTLLKRCVASSIISAGVKTLLLFHVASADISKVGFTLKCVRFIVKVLRGSTANVPLQSARARHPSRRCRSNEMMCVLCTRLQRSFSKAKNTPVIESTKLAATGRLLRCGSVATLRTVKYITTEENLNDVTMANPSWENTFVAMPRGSLCKMTGTIGGSTGQQHVRGPIAKIRLVVNAPEIIVKCPSRV